MYSPNTSHIAREVLYEYRIVHYKKRRPVTKLRKQIAYLFGLSTLINKFVRRLVGLSKLLKRFVRFSLMQYMY